MTAADQNPADSAADLPAPLPAPLDVYQRDFLAARKAADAVAEGLDHAAFNWSVDDKSWSIGQCIEHIYATDRIYSSRMRKCIADARERGLVRGSGEVRYGLFERMFVGSLSPSRNFRMKAPKVIIPPSDLDLETVTEAYRGVNEGLLGLLEEARELDLRRAKIRSPLANWLKFSLGAAFWLLSTHDLRHLAQARRVREHPSFPG